MFVGSERSRCSTALLADVAMPEGNSRWRPSKVAKYGVGELSSTGRADLGNAGFSTYSRESAACLDYGDHHRAFLMGGKAGCGVEL